MDSGREGLAGEHSLRGGPDGDVQERPRGGRAVMPGLGRERVEHAPGWGEPQAHPLGSRGEG